MKKYFSMFAVAAVALFTACSEDALVQQNGDAQTTRITVGIPSNTIATRANTGEFADPTLTGMRVTLFVSSNDKIVSIEQKTGQDMTNSKQVAFDVQLVPGKEYNIAVWADYGDEYFTLPTQEDATVAPVITLANTTVEGNNNKRDAYFATINKTITANEDIDLTMKRPFALVKINTTDWQADAVVNAGYRPTEYSATFQSYSQINLLTGALEGDKVAITTSGTITANDVATKELSFDYLLAADASAILDDFTMTYTQNSGTTSITSYTFTNIPVQRNYQTNITGNILTKKGHVTVSVDPLWDGGHVCDIAGANEIIAANSQANVIDVEFTNEPDDAGVPGTQSGDITSQAILTTPMKQDGILNIKVSSQTKQLYVGDYNSATDINQGVSSSANAATVNINVPSGSSIGTLVINAPSKSVYLNGQLVASAGTLTNVESTTSQNTLVVEKGQSIGTLTVHQGGLEIHGTVSTLVISEDAHDTNPVKVRACENLSTDVFAVIKGDSPAAHDYIDRPAYTEKANSDGTYDIVQNVCKIGETYYTSLSDAISAVPSDRTETQITMLQDVSATSTFTIPGTKNIVLELNGKMIYASTEAASTFALFENKGIFTIQDNTDTQKNGTGTGKLTTVAYNPDMQGVPGYATTTITNYGKLTVKSGLIESASEGSASYAIDHSAQNIEYHGPTYSSGGQVELYIQGGKVISGASQSIRMYLRTNGETDNIVKITGGVIDRFWVQECSSAAKGTLEMDGATFLRSCAIGYNDKSEHLSVSVKNSTFGGVFQYDLDPTKDGNTLHISNISASPFWMKNISKVLEDGVYTTSEDGIYIGLYQVANDENKEANIANYYNQGITLVLYPGYTTWYRGYANAIRQVTTMQQCVKDGYELVCTDATAGTYKVQAVAN